MPDSVFMMPDVITANQVFFNGRFPDTAPRFIAFFGCGASSWRNLLQACDLKSVAQQVVRHILKELDEQVAQPQALDASKNPRAKYNKSGRPPLLQLTLLRVFDRACPVKTLFVAGLLAFLGALLITNTYQPKPLEAQLLHLQVEQTLPEMSDELATEPAQIQALFLAYADDPLLLAKARIALLRYPDIARPLFLTYGESPEFQAVLSRYGEDALLPVQYFVTHEVLTLEFMHKVSETTRKALEMFGQPRDNNPSSSSADSAKVSSEERGWYAIQFVEAEGYDFIGQFVVAPNGQVGWVQTERVLEGINSFFAGGIKGLETRLRREEPIGVGDVGWAALDVAIGVSAFKILRMGKAGAVGGRTLTFSQRSAALGSGLWRGSAIGMRLVKYGAPAVLAYIAIRHPSVINALLGSVAEKLGLPVNVVQVAGWTLVLLPVLLLLRLLLRPLAWIAAAILGLLRSADSLMSRREARAL